VRLASRLLFGISLLVVPLSACRPAPEVSDPSISQTQAFETALAQMLPSGTPVPEATPVPATSLPRTPPALPGVYQSAALNPLDRPHTYVSDTCQYLKDKWDSGHSAPGTIVMVVMFHGIQRDPAVTDPKNVTLADFKKIMNGLKDQGFQAINATQLADFLDSNTKIPERSVVLIQDDRHAAQNFEDFRAYYDQWGWPVINGWISAFGGQDSVLQENVALSKEGWVDYQAHGVVHNINMSDSSDDDFIVGELQGSITNMQQFFDKTPIAIIWPGGGFGIRPVQIARQYGYRLGFTVNPRGPIMYNWVPLADQADPGRPNYLSEGYVNDPRMVLPRYWPAQVLASLDAVRIMGQEAAAFAQQNRAVELDYYDIVCRPTYGPIP